MSRFYGHNAPFLSGRAGNLTVLPRQEDDRLIRNDLLQLLLTAPGERVMRPEWGSPIRTFVFEQMSAQDKDRLIREIRKAIDEQERRVRVTDIQVEFNNSNEAHIKIYGYFSLDRFGLVEDIGRLEQADLLVELNLDTSQFNEQR